MLDGETATRSQHLAQRYERPLLGMARGLLAGNTEDACDAVQGVWVRVLRYANTFNGNSSVKTWLYRILINECRDIRRLNGRFHHVAEDHSRSSTTEATPRFDDLYAALARLPNERREILLLCYHAGMTHEIAAEVLEIPLGTLKSRLHAGLTELRAALAKEDAP